MPPNLGQAANMAFTNAMALATVVTEENDTRSALKKWEKVARPLTEHVQWWSYIYGYIVGRWPSESMAIRNDAILMLAKTKWFEEGINRGARSIPLGFNGKTNYPHTEENTYDADSFEQELIKEMLLSVMGRQVAGQFI